MYNLTIILSCFFIYLSSYAKEEPLDLKEKTKVTVDKTHSYLSDKILWTTSSIDEFFGRFVRTDRKNKSRIVITSRNEYNKEGYDSDIDVDFRFNYPHLEELLKFRLNTEIKNKKKIKKVEESDNKKVVEEVEPNLRWKLTSGLRALARTKPDVFLFVNKQLEYHVDDSILRLRNRVFFTFREGLGDSVFLEYDKQLSDHFLLRFANIGTWRDVGSIFYSHGPELYYQLSDQRNISFSIKANASKKPECLWCINDYNAGITFGTHIYKDWILLRMGPNVNYAKLNDFRARFSFNITLNLFVGTY